MSRYDEDTNPHFWSRSPLPSDFSSSSLIQPESRQPWDEHLYHPDHIQRRQRSRHPRSHVEHDDQPYPSDQVQQFDPIKPRQQESQPYQPSNVSHSPRIPTKHIRQQPESPPSRYHDPPTRFSSVDGPGLQTHIPTQGDPKSKPQSSHRPRPHHVSFEQDATRPPHLQENLMYPQPNRTKPGTWFGAVFCMILWLVIILGGLLVLIIYLVYRPRTPHFEISSATLNSIYLDMGYLLNSDITVLANFTNPNKKVNVDFRYAILKLYYDKYLIAQQYIEPFSAFNSESKLAYVQFIISHVRLPLSVIQRLATQVQKNRVTFKIDGTFHTKSKFGSLFRYSYWLYGNCQVLMAGPPSGAMLLSHCRTKARKNHDKTKFFSICCNFLESHFDLVVKVLPSNLKNESLMATSYTMSELQYEL